MSWLSGVNHITLLTRDLDRLAAFYEEVIRARRLVELPVPEPDGPGRHALIGIGGGTALHAFELARGRGPASAVDVRAWSDRPLRAERDRGRDV